MKLLLAFAAVALLAVSCSALWHGDSDGGKLLANSHRVVALKINSLGDITGGPKVLTATHGDTGGGPKLYANKKGDEGGGPKLNSFGDTGGGPKMLSRYGESDGGPKAYSKRPDKRVYAEAVS